MRILVLPENSDGEKRVALTPDTVAQFSTKGHSCLVCSGAGSQAGLPDAHFSEAGATIVTDEAAALKEADLTVCVTPPDPQKIAMMRKGAGLLGLLDPHTDAKRLEAYVSAGIDAFAMEFVPRISRAQTMDALSSQANLAGYRAVIEAAALIGRVFPMMITAAGSIAPVRVFVMGAGVAGLQAIATARRLGAVVSATDVRPAAKQQVESLAAKFIAVEDDEFREAETASGYAKPMSEAYQAKQAEKIAEHISTQDIIITTALIPGRKAPILVSEAMVESMRPGSVIIDMAVAQGGNCPLSKADAPVQKNGVLIVGAAQLPADVAMDASALYARNLAAYIPYLTNDEGHFSPHWDDEIIVASALTRNSQIIHPAFQS